MSEQAAEHNPNPFGLEHSIDHFFDRLQAESNKLIEAQKLCDPARVASALAHILYASQDRFDPEEFNDLVELSASAATSATVLFANVGSMQRKIVEHVVDSASASDSSPLILPPHLRRQ